MLTLIQIKSLYSSFPFFFVFPSEILYPSPALSFSFSLVILPPSPSRLLQGLIIAVNRRLSQAV